MKIILYLAKAYFVTIYFFIKLFTIQKKQVFLLSRQFNSPSINYQTIMDELDKDNIPEGINDSKKLSENAAKVRKTHNVEAIAGKWLEFIEKTI